MVYTLQLINADTNKLIKEMDYDEPGTILRLFDMVQNSVSEECFFTDDEFVGIKSEYISNNVIDTEKGRTYQLVFKFEMTKVKVI